MFLGLTTGLTSIQTSGNAGGGASAPASPDVFAFLGQRDGFAVDFVRRRMKVNDSQTPANVFDGNPEAKLENHGSDAFLYDAVKGLVVDASRDFSIAMPTSSFPFSQTACTIYLRYRLNAETSSEIRSLFTSDTSGPDRLFANLLVGQPVRYNTGDGTSAHITASSFAPVADTPLTAVMGCDENGKTFVDDGGIQIDSSETLSTTLGSYFGIGGYPSSVLRVLDGHIEQVMVICEPVAKADRLTLTPWPPAVEPEVPEPAVFDVLGGRDGFAIDFVSRQMRINDRTTPANNFTGDPEDKLENLGSDPYQYDATRGLIIDAARDFSIALPTSLFPYNTSACTVYAKYRLNAADSSEQRYLFFAQNSGATRFATYTTSGAGFRFSTGDGTAADIDVSSNALAPDTEHEILFGCDDTGKTFFDEGGLHGDSAHTLQTDVPSHVGIGGYPDRVLRVLDGYLTEIVVITETIPAQIRRSLPMGHVYRAEGDSHTFNTTLGVEPEEFYGYLTAQALGPETSFLNLGGSGDSSAEMIHQLPAMIAGARPDIATIYIGANDSAILVTADTTPTTSTFSVDPIRASRLEPGGHVFVEGQPTMITARNGAEVTVSPPLAQPPATGDGVSMDTETNIGLWIDAMRAEGCQKILVIGYHFINFASGGDTVAAEHPSRAAVRAKQRAAAESRSAPFCDSYAYMRGLIQSGEVTEGDDTAWHVDVGDTHLNAAGEAAVAAAVIARMTELGWM